MTKSRRWLAAMALLLLSSVLAAKERTDTVQRPQLRLTAQSAAHPAGPAAPAADVLYDQIPLIGPYAIAVANYAGAVPEGAMEAHGTDDFEVTAAEGWTVTGFDFVMCCTEDLETWTGVVDVFVYPLDPQGLPSATPLCSAPAATIAWDPKDITSTGHADLPHPCVLRPGKYWLAAAGSERTYNWYAYDDQGPRGQSALWRAPGGSYGEPCRDWQPVYKCHRTALTDVKFNFRVLGHVGRDAGALDLAVTLARFDANAPPVCGSATELTVTVGDQVSVCYSITNRSGTDLHFHTLHDNLAGDLFVQREQALALDERMTFQRVITAGLDSDIVATWTARGSAASYRVDDTAVTEFVELSAASGATELPPTEYPMGDDGGVAVPAPFPFQLFGRTVDEICIGNNGYLLSGSSSQWPFCSPSVHLWANGALPNAQLEWPAILPAWMDLYLDGTTFYQTLGESGSRRFVVEWNQRNRWAVEPAPGAITFEVILEEETGAITFVYQQMAFGDAESPAGDYGEQATVGLQESATSALQYSFGQPLLTNGKAIRWTPTVTDDFTQTASAHLDIGAPTVVATPPTLEATLAAGTSASATLQIANTGNRDLLWNIDSARPTLHFPPGEARELPPIAKAGAAHGRPAPTAASAFKAEQKRLARLRAAAPSGGALEVPAYGTYDYTDEENRFRSLLGRFDAAAATDNFETVALLPGEPFGPPPLNYSFSPSGGAFVDNDLDRLYAITQAGAFGYLDLARDGALEVITVRAQTTPGGDTQWCTFVPPQPCWYGLAWDAATASLYTMGIVYRYDNTDPDYVPISSQLHRIDLQTGLLTAIGAPTPGAEFSDIAIDPQGLMYAIDPTADALYAIDKSSGESRPIGSFGFDARGSGYQDQGLSFDLSTGVLWYATARYLSQFETSPGEMYTVDTLTGAATRWSALYEERPLGSFEIAVRNGPCSRPGEIAWLSYPGATEGIEAPAGVAEVAVKFNAQGLAPGIHKADVCVFSNDPNRRNHPLSVPVRLTVTEDGSEAIFADGFDAASP